MTPRLQVSPREADTNQGLDVCQNGCVGEPVTQWYADVCKVFPCVRLPDEPTYRQEV